MIKKALAGCLALVMVAGSITGCSQGSSPSASKAPEQVTIRFESSATQSDPSYPIVNSIVTQFEKDNPNIKVQMETQSNTQYHEKLKTEIASNTLADVIWNWGGSEMLGAVQGKQIVDLTSILNEDSSYKGAFISNVLKGSDVTYRGIDGIWGIPFDITLSGFYYNTELFQKAGVQPPKTWDELLNVITKLKAIGTIPWAIGAQDGWRAEHLYTAIFYKYNGVSPIYDLADRKAKYSSDTGIGPFQKMEQLRDMQAFGPNPASVDYTMEQNLFMNGKAAMNFSLANYITLFTGDSSPIKGKVGYFPFPYFSDKPQFQNQLFGGPGNALSLSAKSTGAQRDAAIKLIKAFTSPAGQKQFSDAAIMIPTVTVQQTGTPTESMKLQSQFLDTYKAAQANALDVTDPDALPSMLNKLRDVSVGLMNKQLTAQQAAQDMDNEIATNN